MSSPKERTTEAERDMRAKRNQESLDHEQAISDLEQSVGDRDQAIGDIEQDRLDRIESQGQADDPTTAPPNMRDRIRIEHRRLDLARAQARRYAHQEQLDRAQSGRDDRQHLLEHQQATIDEPEVEGPLPSEEDLAREAQRRSEAAVERAEAAAKRAEQALERAEESRLRLEAWLARRPEISP